jgi:hypothetical protein
MPNRTIPLLSVFSGILISVYVVLVCTTVVFAAVQTDLARTLSDTRASIGTLEASYYEKVAELNNTDPASIGLVTPILVQYVSAIKVTGITFAGR